MRRSKSSPNDGLLDLNPLRCRSIGKEARRGEATTEAAACIYGRGPWIHGEAFVSPVVSADDHFDVAVGALDRAEIARAPPQRIALLRQWPVRIEAGMYQQELPVLGERGTFDAVQKFVMAARRWVLVRSALVQRVMATAPSPINDRASSTRPP